MHRPVQLLKLESHVLHGKINFLIPNNHATWIDMQRMEDITNSSCVAVTFECAKMQKFNPNSSVRCLQLLVQESAIPGQIGVLARASIRSESKTTKSVMNVTN